MTQEERRFFLIRYLLDEIPGYHKAPVPSGVTEQKNILRALMNVRAPGIIGEEFLTVQDDYLKEELKIRGVTDFRDLSPLEEGVYLWRGDITTLRCDAIVNAANSGMTGCYLPCHGCIDNAIHTYAGVQLRLECARLMAEQGHDEAAGKAKITPAFNLPSRYVIHTVGPVIRDRVTKKDEALLSSCYRSCLDLAHKYSLESIAFCCISTGEFRFPNHAAARIAVRTVREHRGGIKVIFNVFKESDEAIYRNLLGCNRKA